LDRLTVVATCSMTCGNQTAPQCEDTSCHIRYPWTLPEILLASLLMHYRGWTSVRSRKCQWQCLKGTVGWCCMMLARLSMLHDHEPISDYSDLCTSLRKGFFLGMQARIPAVSSRCRIVLSDTLTYTCSVDMFHQFVDVNCSTRMIMQSKSDNFSISLRCGCHFLPLPF